MFPVTVFDTSMESRIHDRSEYEIRIAGETLPPAPWVNVIGNPTAGLCISESGCGAMWATNSSYRLTPLAQ